MIHGLNAQQAFRKPGKKTRNQLTLDGTYLKTMFTFQTIRWDTLLEQGMEPEVVPVYRNEDIVQQIIQPVLDGEVEVYKANFWGGIPQFLEKTSFEGMDTAQILYQFNAGRDTSYIIETDGSMQPVPVYRRIDPMEISGLFFFESWWLDARDFRFYKDVIAYQPIREYRTLSRENPETTRTMRRLVFMVIPELPVRSPHQIKYRPRDFILLRPGHQYVVPLYNRSYDQYLFREELQTGIKTQEYEEWQYHHFDFYKYFDRDRFLEKIITGVLADKLHACHPEDQKPMNPAELIQLLHNIPEEADYDPPATISPEQYPLNELNSVVFQENWYLNPLTLQIYKEVTALTVNRHNRQFDNYTGEFIRESVDPLFTICF
jgi:hypothetical protein